MSKVWEQVAKECKARRPVVVATVVGDSGSVPRRSGAKMLVYPDGRTSDTIGGGIFEQLVIRDALSALKHEQSITKSYSFNPKGTCKDAFGAVCGGRAEVFLEVVLPPDRLLIVGGGHCGRALAQAASLLDFSIVLADDRAEFSRPDDYAFPGVESVLHLPPDFRGLPAPDVFLETARRLGLPAPRCLVVEDSRNGLLAAKAAGMACAVIPCATTRHQDFREADYRLSALRGLLGLLLRRSA